MSVEINEFMKETTVTFSVDQVNGNPCVFIVGENASDIPVLNRYLFPEEFKIPENKEDDLVCHEMFFNDHDKLLSIRWGKGLTFFRYIDTKKDGKFKTSLYFDTAEFKEVMDYIWEDHE